MTFHPQRPRPQHITGLKEEVSIHLSFSLGFLATLLLRLNPLASPLSGPASSLSRPRPLSPSPISFIPGFKPRRREANLTPISRSHWPESVTGSLDVSLLHGVPTVAMAWFEGQIIMDVLRRHVIGQKAGVWAGLNAKRLAASVWGSLGPQHSLRDTPLFPRYWPLQV